MLHWIVKILALLTVAALVIGMAAECVTLIGDFKSLGAVPTSKTGTFGIMLARTDNNDSDGTAVGSKKEQAAGPKLKPIVCEAYKHNTDFNQRGGAIAHAAAYHLITLIGLTLMLVQQAMRGVMPASLPSLYRFVPALSGGWGLAGSGGVMIYVALQILSYSVGKIHIAAAILLFLAGCLNLAGGFYPPFASADGADLYEGGVGDYGAGGLDGGYGDASGGGAAGGMPADLSDAPDPYDGKDPAEVGGVAAAGYDGSDGVGASAPPPGSMTFGQPADGSAPLPGYGQANAETNPQLAAQGASAGGGTSEVVFDPSTGLWNTVYHAPPAGIQPLPQAVLPGMGGAPIGYDAYGRPILAPPQLGGGLYPGMGMLPAWQQPGILAGGLTQPPTSAVTTDDASSTSRKKDEKKMARKEAKRRYERRRAADDAAAAEEEAERAEREERRARQAQREVEREVRRQERGIQAQARHIAEADAHERATVEAAEEDARKRQSRDALNQRRRQAIQDARRQALERERAFREEEERQAQEALEQAEREHAARAEAEQRERLEYQDEQARLAAAQEEEEEIRLTHQRRELQAQALAAAQEAAHAGRPLQRARDSFLSRASTVPVSRPASQQYYTDEEGRIAWPPAQPHHHHHHHHQHSLLQQPPVTPAVAVPLAPLPGQSSHLSVSPAHSHAADSPYHQAEQHRQPLPRWRPQPSFRGDDEEFVDDLQRPPNSALPGEFKSEDELLYVRMQEERERVLQRQALDEPGAGGYGDDGESIMDFRL